MTSFLVTMGRQIAHRAAFGSSAALASVLFWIWLGVSLRTGAEAGPANDLALPGQGPVITTTNHPCRYYGRPSATRPHQWTVFAGQDLQKGDVVELTFIIPIQDAKDRFSAYPHFLQLLWDPLPSDPDADPGRFLLAGIGSLARHSAEAPNVCRSDDGKALVATRHIRAHEELWVDRSSARGPEDLRSGEPTTTEQHKEDQPPPIAPSHWARADELVRQLARLDSSPHFQQLSEMHWIELLNWFRMHIIKVTETDEVVSQLLPRTREELTWSWKMGTESLWHHRSKRRGSPPYGDPVAGCCGGGIEARPVDATTAVVAASRSFAPGSIVSVVVFKLFRLDELNASESSADSEIEINLLDYCLRVESSPFVLCPVSSGGFFRLSTTGTNVELRWSEQTDATLSTLDQLHELERKGQSVISLEIIATCSIQLGEEIILAPSISTSDSLRFPDEILPFRWRGMQEKKTTGSFYRRESHIVQLDEKLLSSYDSCGLYLAPSTIADAGLGVFMGAPGVGAGWVLGSSHPVIVHHTVNSFFWHRWVVDDYAWEGKNFGAEYESVPPPLALMANVGMLANSNPGYANALLRAKFEPLLDRWSDPGAGASADYEAVFLTSTSISLGEEIFVSYGDNWFTDRNFRDVPLEDNCKKADAVITSVWELSELDAIFALITDDLFAVAIENMADHKTKGLLEQFGVVKDFNSFASKGGVCKSGLNGRSHDWLRNYGTCLDNLEVRKSIVAQAGRGAFARRYLLEGSTIVTSPLLPIFDRKRLVDSDTNQSRLLTNYLFGHPESSLLFFPTTVMTSINHKSGTETNAKLRWTATNKKSQYYLRRPMEELKFEKLATISIDVYALRDIEPGEEVFIDYGEKWEAAWKDYEELWSRPCDALESCPKSSKQIYLMNNDKFNPAFHQWTDDHILVCSQTANRGQSARLIDSLPQGIEADFSFSKTEMPRIPCKILAANKTQGDFDVVMFNKVEGDSREILQLMRDRTFPEDFLEFVSRPKRSDLHWANAFRHEIHIPDEIFPGHWRDKL